MQNLQQESENCTFVLPNGWVGYPLEPVLPPPPRRPATPQPAAAFPSGDRAQGSKLVSTSWRGARRFLAPGGGGTPGDGPPTGTLLWRGPGRAPGRGRETHAQYTHTYALQTAEGERKGKRSRRSLCRGEQEGGPGVALITAAGLAEAGRRRRTRRGRRDLESGAWVSDCCSTSLWSTSKSGGVTKKTGARVVHNDTSKKSAFPTPEAE